METQTAEDPGLAQRLRALIDEAESLLGDTARSGGTALDATREKCGASLHRLNERIGELEEAAASGTRRALGAADRSVREHPYGAIGVAAAVGLLVGALIARR